MATACNVINFSKNRALIFVLPGNYSLITGTMPVPYHNTKH